MEKLLTTITQLNIFSNTGDTLGKSPEKVHVCMCVCESLVLVSILFYLLLSMFLRHGKCYIIKA